MGLRGKKRQKGYTLKYCAGKDKLPYLYIWEKHKSELTQMKRKEKGNTNSYYEWVSLGRIDKERAQKYLDEIRNELLNNKIIRHNDGSAPVISNDMTNQLIDLQQLFNGVQIGLES
ncbi:hypothetical protein [Gottfriedia acidiceleris]|uniref:Uncharacterized protein n=1 Tax=Gottfriedia acidiceleris TaxID=371036 RepID=A0ABY4JF27_9BACI|nr:hypothetical protein [Gottfriedia acidiceleris]UPM52444.1 hypothetical protein MY490_11365 [Gottfriedia acidiceleris]